MRQQLPNHLTLMRLVLAGLFFVVLPVYRYPVGPDWALTGAIALFLLAAFTDFLDGHLARRWQVESIFGRIMDPFCDKVLIIGAFIFLTGPRFVVPATAADPDRTLMATGVYPWMVALILARELLVTGIRGELEGRGVAFGANLWGKLKAILQMATIPILLLIVGLDPYAEGRQTLAIVRDLLVWAVVIVTVLSGIPYVTSAVASLRRGT